MSLASIGSLVGGALILAAFIALQLGRVDAEDRRYQVLNLVGGIVLVASALLAELWGFVVLNVVWAAASAWALTHRPSASQHR
jgi:ethanolamine transporter EutH